MKKIVKAISLLAATTALTAGVAIAATGCSSGYNGTYTGEYTYEGPYGGHPYGMQVEVTVKNNIITGVKDVTDATQIVPVSTPWEDYCEFAENGAISYSYWAYPDMDFTGMTNEERIAYVKAHPVSYYNWTKSNVENWTKHENWLLQQYVGWSVADVLDIKVYTDTAYKDGKVVPGSMGEPYGTAGGWNAELQASGLLISGATQGSGRLLLAVQNALSK